MKKKTLLNTWAILIYYFSQWLMTVIVTRIAGYENAGNFTMAVSFTNIFGFVARFGVRNIQISDTRNEYSDGLLFTTRLVTSIVSIIIFILSLIACNYRIELVHCCITMMLFKLAESFDDLFMGTFQRQNKYKQIAVSYTIKSVIPPLLFTILLLKKTTLDKCILMMCISYCLILLFYDAKRIGQDLFRFELRKIAVLLKRCVPLIGVSLIDAVILYLPRNAIEKVLGATELGYYGAISIFVVVLSTLSGAVWLTLIPEISRLIEKKEWNNFYSCIKKSIIMLLLFSIVFYFLGNALGPFFYKIIYGEKILIHIEILPYMILSAVLLLLNSFFQCIFIPLRKQNILFYTDLVAVGTCFAVSNVLTQKLGLSGASIGLAVSLFSRLILLSSAFTIFILKNRKELKL